MHNLGGVSSLKSQTNFKWRVTKYNPAFRDKNGIYTLTDDWTCPSEIGNTINGKPFTMTEYQRVEKAYLDSVQKFMEESNTDSLTISEIEYYLTEEDRKSPLYKEEFEQLSLQNHSAVTTNEVRLICQMILRNFLWCNLDHKDEFFVKFGWDYYMYIGSHAPCPDAIHFATRTGLFVEEWEGE